MSETTQYWYVDKDCIYQKSFEPYGGQERENIIFTIISKQWVSKREVGELGLSFSEASGNFEIAGDVRFVRIFFSWPLLR